MFGRLRERTIDVLGMLEKRSKTNYLPTDCSKTAFDESFRRMLLDIMEEPMYVEGESAWLNHCDLALSRCNNRKHSPIKMTSFEAYFNSK